MVVTLIDLRAAMLRHSAARVPVAGLVALAAFGLVCAAGTIMLAAVRYAHPGAGADVLALSLAVWMLGHIGQSALAGGDATLRPELFRLLPISSRRLARALLVVGLADPSLPVLAIAYAALVVLGAHAGLAAALVGVLSAALTLLVTSALSTLAGGLLAPASRRGRDRGTVLLALAISVVAAAGALLPVLARTLTGRESPALSLVVRLLPSGWGPLAVDDAGRPDWAPATAALLGLTALTAATVCTWPTVLARRMDGANAPIRTAHHKARPLGLSPRTPTGAVAAKELALWGRDPVRLTCLLIAAIVGAATCAIPHLTTGTNVLLPFAGAISVVIAGACATNLYAADGPSLWLSIVAPDSAGPDVRGRQAAWLLLVGPYAIAITSALTAISGQSWAWPWVLGCLPALLGAAAGLAAYGSLVSVQPADEAGNPTPAWSLKVHLALPVIALAAAPPALVLFAAAITGHGWLSWAAVPTGLVTGVAFALCLGHAAIGRLQREQLTVLARLTGHDGATNAGHPRDLPAVPHCADGRLFAQPAESRPS